MKTEFRLTILFIVVFGVGLSGFYFSDSLTNQANQVHYRAWTDIGHVTLVLPLFDGSWHYRYDIQTNFHGLITLREQGLPQPNAVSEPFTFWCSNVQYQPHAFSLNQTLGVIYYPACGYEVVPQ